MNPDYSTYNDNQLLQLIAGGDDQAFAVLLQRYQAKVYNQALTYLDNVKAQEITQDIFIKIWMQRDKLVNISSLDNYLFILSRNEIISSLRKKGLHLLEINENSAIDHDHPEARIINKETGSRILFGIEQLPPQRRKVFLMSRMEGRTYNEIANKLNISRNGVKDHIVKALTHLRNFLGFF